MKIGIVGLGYVGLVTGIALANAGNEIIGIDIDESKVNSLKDHKLPIYEPGLKEAFASAYNKITFSTDYSLLKGSEVVYVIVPTPTVEGKIVLDYVFDACDRIKDVTTNAIIAIKSTVVPGTARKISEKLGMTIVSNPEFTKEGTAIEDTIHPDRIVIGSDNQKALDVVSRIWSFTNAPILKMTNENAELIKYASNAFLATKISFINEIANLCERIPGADVEVVAKGMGFDKRIAPYFLRAGIGYGGSCFPKDTKAIAEFARGLGEELKIIDATIKVNEDRVDRVYKMINVLLNGKIANVGILGIAFKDNTNDTRESQSLKLINKLKSEGFNVNVYDPVVKVGIDNFNICNSIEECIASSDILVIATEWNEFKSIKTNKPIIDAKRILYPNKDNIVPIGFGQTKRKTKT
jgi:UDPglucose 6-dehydrogenase